MTKYMMKYVDEIICWLPTQKKTAEFETSEIFFETNARDVAM